MFPAARVSDAHASLILTMGMLSIARATVARFAPTAIIGG